MFQGARIAEAVWPEILGVGTYAVGELVAASIDSAMKGTYTYPVAQTGVTGICLVGGVAGVGYNWAPGFSTGLIYGSGIGIFVNLVRSLYEAATKQPARMRPEDFPALIPRRVGALTKEVPGGGLKIDTGSKLDLIKVGAKAGAAANPIPIARNTELLA